MALPGERLLISAMLDDVTLDETFDTIPPHMSLVRWFDVQENRRFRILTAMDRFYTNKPSTVFDESETKRVTGSGSALFDREGDEVLVRRLRNVQTAHHIGFHALVRSLGSFDPEDPFSDVFTPHVTNTRDRSVRRGEVLEFSSVALIADEGPHTQKHVLDVFPLGVSE